LEDALKIALSVFSCHSEHFFIVILSASEESLDYLAWDPSGCALRMTPLFVILSVSEESLGYGGNVILSVSEESLT